MTTTYIPLATTTLASATNTVTFSSISSSYTDLVLVINYQASGGAVYAQYRLNGDSGSNYRRNVISGNGSTAGNYNSGSESYMYAANTIYAGSGQWATLISNFNNYSNTTTNKTAIHRFSEATIGTEATISSWNSTAAINSITINTNGNNFGIGSTFSLYGIASAAISGAKATGGDIVATDGTYWYHAFRGSGTFTPTSTLSCDVFVVAGGAGGGGAHGGGGGAGGLYYSTSNSVTTTAYTVTVGAGGAGSSTSAAGTNGSNSVFGALTAAVGGGGGGSYSGSPSSAGSNGGSGGGGSNYPGNTAYSGGTGTSGQGYAGGSGSGQLQGGGGGGGGGAGAVGSAGTNQGTFGGGGGLGGAGGTGTNTYSAWLSATGSGVSGYIAGGGGGGSYNSATYNGSTSAAGGSGGGGGGGYSQGPGNYNPIAGTTGTANTGGGGGGGAGNGGSGVAGGSGLVIVRYPI